MGLSGLIYKKHQTTRSTKLIQVDAAAKKLKTLETLIFTKLISLVFVSERWHFVSIIIIGWQTGFEFSRGLLAPRFTVGSPKVPTLRARLVPRICQNFSLQILRYRCISKAHFTRHYHYRPILLHFSSLANTNEHLEVPSEVKSTILRKQREFSLIRGWMADCGWFMMLCTAVYV